MHCKAHLPMFLALGLLVACGGETPGEPGDGEPTDQVASVSVQPTSQTLAYGTSVQLTATVTDAAGSVLAGRTVTWSSSDTDIATVDQTGLVRGTGPGSAMITATADGESGTATVTVTPLVLASVSAGNGHSCGVTTAGVTYCWGTNWAGQLGDGSTTDRGTPVPIASPLSWQSVSAGEIHSCGITVNGDPYCWGRNSGGELGIGSQDTETHPVPEAVSGGLSLESVTAGDGRSCGIVTGGIAYCWGGAEQSPAAVQDGLTFSFVSAGDGFACGVTTDGAAYCWGSNDYGQLGSGNTMSSDAPVPVAGDMVFESVSAGQEFGHACGVTNGNAAYCWGYNSHGQLGNGTLANHSAPFPVSGDLSFSVVGAGNFHSCGLMVDGAAYCWGNNSVGQLGDGSQTDSAVPVAVSGGLAFTSLTVGAVHTCGITTSGVAFCWGMDSQGSLGVGSALSTCSYSGNTFNCSTTPARVVGQQ